ncbi:family 8 carbohydrate esterase [Pseudomassariella vexata]|uniref:Pectinesterase n=1 Tax=Pseudomassariella vexata TaxID=1141098 RepID=A0A1Y2D7P0_9PEZI|nr:family 8 carbohydrate esterase [Pseudomassariella vexata]ORY55291.1 family 8 carbohydrate esterase [Pseudomassariella vexata]
MKFLFLLPLITTVLGASRTSPPSGCIHVAKSGDAYSSVQSAVDSLSTSSSTAQCIFLDQGTYSEQVYIAPRSAQLTIYGYTADTTGYAGNKAIITHSLSAASAGSNDASGTLRVAAANLKVYNVNVINSYGSGSQAIALSAQASSGYYGCSFYGFQDTLLANKGSQYYEKCLITGATDFIFGQQAAAWFEACDIRVRKGGYYITANGRDSSSNPSYYLFNGGTIAAASGESVSSGTYYLGRPWRTYSRVVYQTVSMSNVIRSEGWSTWNGDTDVDNVYYGEYANTGDGASGTRVSWAQKLSSAVSISTVLGSSYASQGYYDASY